MPRTNRVTPTSQLVAVAARGTLMGNRGVLHDAHGRLTGRGWTTQAWVTCRLSFKGRRRRVMAPGRYTELFFLDEPTALAAGHRPCGECRREDYRRYKAFWAELTGLPPATPIGPLDRRLHEERRRRGVAGETHQAPLANLPDGAMVVLPGEGDPWLVWGESLLRWSPAGYTECRARAGGWRAEPVAVLTPPCTVGVLAAGYRPEPHPSARAATRSGGQP